MRSHSNVPVSPQGEVVRLGLVSIVRSDALSGRTKNVVIVLFEGGMPYYASSCRTLGTFVITASSGSFARCSWQAAACKRHRVTPTRVFENIYLRSSTWSEARFRRLRLQSAEGRCRAERTLFLGE